MRCVVMGRGALLMTGVSLDLHAGAKPGKRGPYKKSGA